MNVYPGFDIQVCEDMNFTYGEGVFGPIAEKRRLDDIRSSLFNPDCVGPDVLYSIVMDTGEIADKQAMIERNLLFGVVTYAKGCIGEEPVRSQGHKHALSASCQSSTCEVYQIFDGEAYIYMQERGENDVIKCIAVHAKAGDIVIVPPNWIHATINANIEKNMTFGAWCVRDYGFDYDEVKAHKGIAFFPYLVNKKIRWKKNECYDTANLEVKEAFAYPQFHIAEGTSIYTQFKEDPNRFLFVSQPKSAEALWKEM